MTENWVKNLISSIKNFISSLFPPACYEFCYKEKERDGYAVFGMCGGVTGGDYYTDYLSYSCIECPYLVLTSPNEKEKKRRLKMNKIKAALLSLEKKLRACPDSKQKAIDKDIFNLLVAMTKRMEELEKEMEEMNKTTYTWRDIIKIGDNIYAETFPISGEMDDGRHYQIDEFLQAVAKKHGVDVDDVKTYMMDNIEFDARELPYGAESCGCYINGVPEWVLDIDRKESED